MSDHIQPPDSTLLARYLSGECTPSERQAVEHWLHEDPVNRQQLDVLAAAWARLRETDAAEPDLDVRRFWQRIRERIDVPGPPSITVAPPARTARRPPAFAVRSPSRWLAAGRVAAAIALVTGAAFAVRALLTRPPRPEPAPEFSVVSTTRGQRLSIRLADGTMVTLAPGTILRTPSTYGLHDRSVQLEGEAAFTVTHDSARPFSVHTARAVARDLGTRFVVRAYTDDALTDVVVAEGRVAVGRDVGSDSLVVARAERARVDRDGHLALTKGVPLDRYFGWTEGRIVFRRTPLREAIAQLSRWYDLRIDLDSPALGDRGLTATFGEREPVSQVLQVISTVLGLEVDETGAGSYRLRARS